MVPREGYVGTQGWSCWYPGRVMVVPKRVRRVMVVPRRVMLVPRRVMLVPREGHGGTQAALLELKP